MKYTITVEWTAPEEFEWPADPFVERLMSGFNNYPSEKVIVTAAQSTED